MPAQPSAILVPVASATGHDPSGSPAPLPLARGDWVATNPDMPFQVGRVRDCYRAGDGEVLVDVVLHEPTGNRVGRASPAMGGPGGFEPAIPFSDWRRIKPPSFPLERVADHSPGTGEGGETRVRLNWGYHPTVADKPVRTSQVLRAVPTPSAKVARNSDYDPESEAAGRRLAAQELRDLARTMPEASAALKEKAARLEAEADAISPRRR